MLIGLLFSGALARWGLFQWISRMSPDNTGLTPAFLTEEELNCFTFKDIPNLTNHVSLVTGANIGLGYWTSLHLARRGSTVIMACRNNKKCEEAQRSIQSNLTSDGLTNGKVITMELDTSSLKSVDNFTKKFLSKYNRLDECIFNGNLCFLYITFGGGGVII